MNSTISLSILGWDERLEQSFIEHSRRGMEPGRVALVVRDAYTVLSKCGSLPAQLSGAFRHHALDGELPAVGDWVALQVPDGGSAIVHAVMPRHSALSRKVAGTETREQVMAANIDGIFVVSSLTSELNLRRIERYLTSAYNSGAAPAIVLTKADLHHDVSSVVSEVEAIAPGTPVHALSARTGAGMDELLTYFVAGQTIALIGSSGVGKSTLVNHLAREELLAVQSVRTDDKGRHTTTYRRMVALPTGGFVIDTPGMRELQLWEGSLEDAFDDIEDLARQCRFNDCRHADEPGCAVREAIQKGVLAPSRLSSYDKLQRELRFVESKRDARSRSQRRDKIKARTRASRQKAKLESSRGRSR